MAGNNVINKLLNIEKEEQSSVYLLLLQTVFLGIFIAIFEISATGLFINTYGESMLSQAYLVSGIVGFTLTIIYSRLHARIKFSKLIIFNFLLIFILTILLRLSFFFSDSQYLIFAVFVMMGPLNILGIVGFWGVASRLFTLRQGKRLFGLIDSGQIVGMIIISVLVPVLLNLLPDNKDLLYISGASVFIAFIVQLIISGKFNLNKSSTQENSENNERISIGKILKNKYVVYMALFVILSMVAAFFVVYVFLPVTKAKYPGNDEYYTFLGGFTAALMTFTLLIKTLAYNKLTKAYGLKVTLLLPAFLLGIFVVLAIFVGTFFGYSIEVSTFMLFFLLISLGRLFSVSLKSSLEVPSLKLLYQSLDSNIRFRVQVMIDGMVNETAAIIAGVILLIFSLLRFIETIHYLYFLVAIIIAWVFVAIKLYKEYHFSLEVTLDKTKETKTESIKENEKNITENIIENSNLTSIIEYTKALEPIFYEKLYIKCLNSNKDFIKKDILNRIKNEYSFGLTSQLKDYSHREKNIENRKYAEELVKQFEKLLNKNEVKLKLPDLVNSVYPKDRIIAANVIKEFNNNETSKFLIILLRDFSIEVRMAAIKAAAVIKDKESLPIIVDYLSNKQLNIYAYETLKQYGEEALHQLELYFYKSGLNHKEQIQILRLFGLSKSKDAIKYLLNKLNYFSREIVIESCSSLQKCKYIAKNDEEKQPLNQLIIESIKIVAWNMNILININESEIGTELKETIIKEIEHNYDEIYQILSITYKPSSVLHVRENLETDTAEGISFGLELLDLFVDENTKTLLFILFEDVSYNEKIKRFQDYFALEKLSSVQILNSIINRDINFISKWTKAIAIKNLTNVSNYNITSDIIAQIFNDDKLLSQLAAKVTSELDHRQFTTSIERLDKQKMNELKGFIRNKNINIIYETIGLLKSLDLFKNVKNSILSEIIAESTEIKIGKSETIEVSSNTNDLYILLSGDISIGSEKDKVEYNNINIIDFKKLMNSHDIIVKANDNSRILVIEFNVLCNYMKYYNEISEIYLEIV